MVVRCLSTLDLHRVRVSLSLEFLQPLVTRIVSSSRVSRIETPLFFRSLRSTGRSFRPGAARGKTRGKRSSDFWKITHQATFTGEKKLIERTTESGVDGRTRSLPRFERQSILSPPPLYPSQKKKEEKGLGSKEIEMEEREREGRGNEGERERDSWENGRTSL